MHLPLKFALHLIVSIALGCLIHYFMKFEIPADLKGWLMISVITPVIASLLSTSTWLTTLHNSFIHSHTWEKDVNGPEVIDWFSVYLLKHKVWSYESLSKIIHTSRSIWWNESDWKTRPQIFEIPAGWILFKYHGTYLMAHYPHPEANHYGNKVSINHSITVKSAHEIDWAKFVEEVRDYYFDNLESGKMAYYRIDGDYLNKRERQIMSARRGASIDICFGDPVKEKLWQTMIEFQSAETKEHFRSLDQAPKTSVLIHGPPGTGKSEMLYQLASCTWKDHRKPIYALNPRGMEDSDLERYVSEIQSGYILVNEWDLALVKSSKEKGEDDEGDLYPSIKAWLDVLDQAQGEIIFWFTTNNYEKLAEINDGALIRDGRIDHRIKFDLMTASQAKKALKHFVKGQDNLIESLVDEDLEGLTISKIIRHLKYKYPLEELKAGQD